MRLYILLLLVLFSAKNLHGQVFDTRAVLETKGGRHLVVSPDEKLWLVTTTGGIFYCSSMDSTWHYGPDYSDTTEGGFGVNCPHLERVSFFNKDTAIVSGYISAINGDSQ